MKPKPIKESSLSDVMVELNDLKEKLSSLEEQSLYTQSLIRILVHPILISELTGVFKTPKQMRAYELSNGERSTRDIGKLISYDQKGISTWWREWGKIGIAAKTGRKGQFKANYTLFELLIVNSGSKKQKASSQEAKNG